MKKNTEKKIFSEFSVLYMYSATAKSLFTFQTIQVAKNKQTNKLKPAYTATDKNTILSV